MNSIIEPTSPVNAEHYVWGEVCDGWHLLKEPDLSVIEERVPPGAGEAQHFHSTARQYFFVLSGRATLQFDGREVSFGSGQGVHVPPGVVHRFVNASSDEVRFIVISAPSTRGDRTNV
jgi:mannose-6-phosphate isomerase-like protein (cupin superfamily)